MYLFLFLHAPSLLYLYQYYTAGIQQTYRYYSCKLRVSLTVGICIYYTPIHSIDICFDVTAR